MAKATKSDQIKQRLAIVFRDLQCRRGRSFLKSRATQDFVFHMTDWAGDLERLSQLYRSPSKYSQKKWTDEVHGFLIHVIGHLLEACRLYGYVLDPFEVISQLTGVASRGSWEAKRARKKKSSIKIGAIHG